MASSQATVGHLIFAFVLYFQKNSNTTIKLYLYFFKNMIQMHKTCIFFDNFALW